MYVPVPVVPLLPVLPVGRGGGTGLLGEQGSQESQGSHGRSPLQGCLDGSGLSAGEHGKADSEPKNFNMSSDCFNLSQIGVKLP